MCILCVCRFFFLIRNIHIKHWGWCLVHEVTFNSFVVLYSMCKYMYEMYIYYCYKQLLLFICEISFALLYDIFHIFWLSPMKNLWNIKWSNYSVILPSCRPFQLASGWEYKFYNVHLLGCDSVRSGRHLQVFSVKSVCQCGVSRILWNTGNFLPDYVAWRRHHHLNCLRGVYEWSIVNVASNASKLPQ